MYRKNGGVKFREWIRVEREFKFREYIKIVLLFNVRR